MTTTLIASRNGLRHSPNRINRVWPRSTGAYRPSMQLVLHDVAVLTSVAGHAGSVSSRTAVVFLNTEAAAHTAAVSVHDSTLTTSTTAGVHPLSATTRDVLLAVLTSVGASAGIGDGWSYLADENGDPILDENGDPILIESGIASVKNTDIATLNTGAGYSASDILKDTSVTVLVTVGGATYAVTVRLSVVEFATTLIVSRVAVRAIQ